MSAVDELAVGDGWPGGGAAEQEIGQIGDASAVIEAVVPLARIARQMLALTPWKVPLSQVFTLLNEWASYYASPFSLKIKGSLRTVRC